MRPIGLHLRMTDNPFDVVQQAIAMQLPIFQTFVTTNTTQRLATFSDEECEHFMQLTHEHVDDVYIHISYHANACEPMGVRVLRRELELAQRLGIRKIVMHPGSGKWCGDKEQGIAVLIKALDSVMREYPAITVLLENTAHGSLSVGGDIQDFARVLDVVKHPGALQICIDTAHAYVYGYNLADDHEQEIFIQMFDEVVGLERVGLIHLNDTTQTLGSKLDQHAVMGQGNIGKQALVKLVQRPELKNVPIILEPPVLAENEIKQLYQSCRGDLL